MIALDTNVVVRIVTRDDPDQADAAVAALEGQRLWLAKTVLLETERVLRYSYELSRLTVEHTFLQLLGLENLEVEDRAGVLGAISSWREGMDFADALHLASCRNADSFLTFDRRLAEVAKELDLKPAVVLESA